MWMFDLYKYIIIIMVKYITLNIITVADFIVYFKLSIEKSQGAYS